MLKIKNDIFHHIAAKIVDFHEKNALLCRKTVKFVPFYLSTDDFRISSIVKKHLKLHKKIWSSNLQNLNLFSQNCLLTSCASRSTIKIKRKTVFPFVFCSLICIFAPRKRKTTDFEINKTFLDTNIAADLLRCKPAANSYYLAPKGGGMSF